MFGAPCTLGSYTMGGHILEHDVTPFTGGKATGNRGFKHPRREDCKKGPTVGNLQGDMGVLTEGIGELTLANPSPAEVDLFGPIPSAVPKRASPSSRLAWILKFSARPVGPLGFNFSQHGPTTRPSCRKDCRESIYAFGSRLALQCRVSCRGDSGWFCPEARRARFRARTFKTLRLDPIPP